MWPLAIPLTFSTADSGRGIASGHQQAQNKSLDWSPLQHLICRQTFSVWILRAALISLYRIAVIQAGGELLKRNKRDKNSYKETKTITKRDKNNNKKRQKLLQSDKNYYRVTKTTTGDSKLTAKKYKKTKEHLQKGNNYNKVTKNYNKMQIDHKETNKNICKKEKQQQRDAK